MSNMFLKSLALVAATLSWAPYAVHATEANELGWVLYAEEANGDRYFYDASHVEQTGTQRRVWTGIRYKTSVMGAFSYSDFLEIDCSTRSAKSLQRTFFSDADWEKPAMKTDTSEKMKQIITVGSITEKLAAILCD